MYDYIRYSLENAYRAGYEEGVHIASTQELRDASFAFPVDEAADLPTAKKESEDDSIGAPGHPSYNPMPYFALHWLDEIR